MELWTLLKGGGEYSHAHVDMLRRGLARVAPKARLICLTDEPLGTDCLTLAYGWPGWWSKMELFRPGIEGDILYADLDTVLVGDLTTIFAAEGSIVLTDFYKGDPHVGSGLMRLTEEHRRLVWHSWISDPDDWMRRAGQHGDQWVIGSIIANKCRRWQKVVPGQVISYKTDIVRKGRTEPPADARIVCFHGQPRPWAVDHAWVRA